MPKIYIRRKPYRVHYPSEETKQKMSLTHKKRWKENPALIEKYKGRHLSEETKKKLSLFMRGRPSPLKGKHISELAKRKREGRKLSDEHKRKIGDAGRGEKNAFWRGGISFEPYTLDWTETLKRSIRERDHYTCQLCGVLQGDKTFGVHHIDYDKKNCNPNNLIILCARCHTKTNGNRGFWSKFLRGKLEKGEI